MLRSLRRICLVALPASVLVACNRESTEPAETNQPSNAAIASAAPPITLIKADGTPAGSVSIGEDSNGVSATIAIAGLSAGVHGAHLHAVGKCDGPKFASAGAHWNPTSRKHGRDSAEGAHLGDLANIQVGADGRGESIFLVEATRNALADADGTSLVIHAERDDYKTDPSGNSGDRIACAVISRPQ